VIDKYRPDLLWFDGCIGKEKFFRSAFPKFQEHKKLFLAYYYNRAKQWGRQVAVTYKHEDLPKGAGIFDIERGRMDKLVDFKWLTDTSVDLKSWCYIKDPQYKSVDNLVDELIDIVSKNGNMLLNVGPAPDGTIPAEQKRLLLGIGKWLKVNGEAIYGTRPWKVHGEGPTTVQGGSQSDRTFRGYTKGDIRFTTKGGALYAISLAWPGETLTVKSLADGSALRAKKIAAVTMLGTDAKIRWSRDKAGLTIHTPKARPCEHAFVFRVAFK
jgi:alpha-L-fucosidase